MEPWKALRNEARDDQALGGDQVVIVAGIERLPLEGDTICEGA
jgi:hypothetical protein